MLGLPFRTYPTRREQQSYVDERHACRDCLSGACCETEDPIYLTGLDVFRLATFFSVAPAEFLLTFTQERFGDWRDEFRSEFIDDPDSSIVTYLRRRANFSGSPCIFLKYVREADGTSRRVCSVYEARPLACREFYFNHCKKRVTGEFAALLAEGYEKVRDGEITQARVDVEMDQPHSEAEAGPTLAQTMQECFWAEMRRALDIERANSEGADSYNISEFQDPIDEKLNRVLSAKHVRFEERYGPRLRGEQLTPYAGGLGFASSPERERIMKIVRTPPSSAIYAAHGDGVRLGLRTLFPGVKYPEVYATIPGDEVMNFVDEIPAIRLFAHHDMPEVRAITLRDVYAAVLKGYNYLIRFASYLTVMGDVAEDERPGEFESDMLSMIAGFQTSLNPFLASNPYFEPVKYRLAEVTLNLMESDLGSAGTPREVFDILCLICRVYTAVPTLAPELRARFEALTREVHARLEKSRLDLYVRLDSPVEARRLAGKRLNAHGAWTAWSDQVLDMRYAAVAGFDGVDLVAFYRQSADDLEKIPFRRSYGLDLYNVVRRLARSMSFDNTIAYREMSYKDVAGRVAAYAVRLFNWMEETSFENDDCEILAEFPSAIYRGLGMSYNRDPSFGLIIYRILDTQLADGSWKTNPLTEDAPGCQPDYLRLMYGATWACLDALRPLRTDILDPENEALSLV